MTRQEFGVRLAMLASRGQQEVEEFQSIPYIWRSQWVFLEAMEYIERNLFAVS